MKDLEYSDIRNLCERIKNLADMVFLHCLKELLAHFLNQATAATLR